ncbi:TonB-dependent receptor plug domain-containing protein [Psittacicella hinzii]
MAIAASLSFAPALAQAEDANLTLSTITVVGQTATSTPGTTTTTPSASITLRDFFQNTPGVDFLQGGYGKIEALFIRGVGGLQDDFGAGGGRVALDLDGIPLPTSFKFGHDPSSGISYFDTANLASAQISRGSTFDSDSTGVAGRISLRTRGSEDVLLPGRNFGGQIKAGYDRRYNSWYYNLAAATKFSRGGVIISFTKRKSENAQITDPDKQALLDQFTARAYDIYAKAYVDLTEDNRISVSVNRFRNPVATPQMANPRNPRSVEHNEVYSSRWTFALSGEHYGKFYIADKIDWTLARQSTYQDVSVFVKDVLPIPGVAVGTYYTSTHSASYYTTTGKYAKVKFTKNFNTGSLKHTLVYGLNANTEEFNTVNQDQIAIRVPGMSSDQNNTKQYISPKKRNNLEVYLSDRIALTKQPLTFTPSVKYARLHSKTHNADTTILSKSQNGNASYYSEAVEKMHAWNWGLKTDWQINQRNILSLNLVQATRLPSFSELNPGTYYHWETIPASDLKPEVSRTAALDWTFNGDWYKHIVSLAATRYTHMIYVQPVGEWYDWGDGYVEYLEEKAQLSNYKAPTQVFSIEYTGQFDFGKLTPALNGWGLNVVVAWARGYDKQFNEPLNTISPLSGNVALTYTQQYFNTFARLNWSAAKKTKDIGSYDHVYGGTSKPIPGWGTLDIGYTFTPNKYIELSAIMYNVFDKEYQLWSNVAMRSGTKRDNYWEAGRGLAFNLSVKF